MINCYLPSCMKLNVLPGFDRKVKVLIHCKKLNLLKTTYSCNFFILNKAYDLSFYVCVQNGGF